MNLLSRYLDDAYITWLGSAVSCCSPQLRDNAEQRPLRGAEKSMTILHHQPRLVPSPLPEPQERPHTQSSSREWLTRTRSLASRASSRGSFSVKRRVNAYNGLRRPQIGAPTDFRHVQNALPTRRGLGFRPLELSIYMPENQLSPILPHFGPVDDERDSFMSFPPTAPVHTRSESAMSNFSIPRKPLNSHKSFSGRIERTASGSDSEWAHPLRPRPSLPESPSTQELMAALEHELPTAPPQARLRSNTGPARILHADSQRVAKVKSILQEKVELERRLRDIDSIIEERQSIYMSSRAGSVYAASEEPMPDLSTSELTRMPRPKTAPTKPTVHIPLRATSFSEASFTFSRNENDFPPPPLPLVLQQTVSRPPLRKKKSFSRVSNWLFPEHTRNISMDSVTNTPKPVTSREGFYQCVDPKAGTKNVSVASVSAVSAVSTVSTMESEMDGPTLTVGTAWTPDSSPGRAPRDHGNGMELELVRMRTFGEEKEIGKEGGIVFTREFGAHLQHRVSSVGVAF